MIWFKARIHRLGARGLLALALLSLAGVFAAGYAAAASSSQSKPDARLREFMTQRYELLRGVMKDVELMSAHGRVDILMHEKLLDALYRAQADLVTTVAERREIYEKLVEALTAQEKLAERQGDAGRLSSVQVAQVKLVLLNAQIDLERLRLGQTVDHVPAVD